MTYPKTQERRTFFRLRYPQTERPKLIISENEFDVTDISEHGIKFYLGSKINAMITFHDGESLSIEGKIIRIQNNEVAVYLSQGIPSDRIIEEQKNVED